jgi:AcrR family transcriptional regulator
MAKRSYASPKRQEAAADTRAELLAAACALLSSKEGVTALTIDAVAKRAGTARMTVYNHFASKDKMLEALFLDLALRGGLTAVPGVLHHHDPAKGLDRVIQIWGEFWSSQPIVLSRLRALAALDPAVGKVVAERDLWRRQILAALLERLLPAHEQHRTEVLNVLVALTSLEGFGATAGPGRPIAEATPVIQRTARTLLGQRPR